MTESPQTRGLSGSDLAARREQMQMTLAQVAGALLLSQRHVEALEADEPAAFYNRNFYDQARRRYAVLLELVDAKAPSAIEPAPADESPAPVLLPRQAADSLGTRPAAAPARGLPTKALILALLASTAGIYVVSQGDAVLESIRGALPTAPVATAPLAPARDDAVPESAPSTAQPLPAPLDKPTGNGPGPDSSAPDARQAPNLVPQATAPEPAFLFEAQRLCWVFARQTSGQETKVTLKAGQRLALPEDLRYLAVGDLSAIRILVDGEPRDLGAFSSDGRVARLGPAELRSLRTGSPPASSSNTAVRSDVEVGHP
ncbi:MAG: helix-turn-helix domain-containing protein [Burkholderiales bacterium]